MTATRPVRRTVPIIVAMLALTGCASGEGAGDAPTPSTSAAPTPSASALPPASPSPSASSEPAGARERFETSDGLFAWMVPADWEVVDESFEAEDDLGHVNQITVVSDRGQTLAFFGSAYYGDRGGICGDWDGDGTSSVPAVLHLDEQVRLGEGLRGFDGEAIDAGRIVAVSARTDADTTWFSAGYTLDPVDADSAGCFLHHDVPVPEDYPGTSFGTTRDANLWQVASFEQGTAYAQTEEFAELMEMFRSLELLQ